MDAVAAGSTMDIWQTHGRMGRLRAGRVTQVTASAGDDRGMGWHNLNDWGVTAAHIWQRQTSQTAQAFIWLSDTVVFLEAVHHLTRSNIGSQLGRSSAAIVAAALP